MARLIQLPPKYSPQEWQFSNDNHYNSAENERAAAERLRDETLRLCHETAVTTIKSQTDVNKKLDQRITDIRYWKGELDRIHAETCSEIDTLIHYKERLESALQDTEIPLEIAKQCLAHREKRQKIDLVHDNVEIELLKEVEVIEGVQGLLRRTLEETVEQIRLLRSAKYYLEKDMKDKLHANSIDNSCATLNNTSGGLHFTDSAVKVENNSVTPNEWEEFSNKNFLKADRERNSSINLRSVIDGVLTQTLNDLSKQCDTANIAFDKRIAETIDAKTKLENHHAKVLDEVDCMEVNIVTLKQNIQAKEAPMKVAQTRLDNRTMRPNMELCRDRVQYRLITEVSEINTSVENLQKTLAASEESLKGLIRNQLQLEDDIRVKANSLHIDKDICVELRKQIVHRPH